MSADHGIQLRRLKTDSCKLPRIGHYRMKIEIKKVYGYK